MQPSMMPTCRRESSLPQTAQPGKHPCRSEFIRETLIVPHALRGNAAPYAPRPLTRNVIRSATTQSVEAIIRGPA